MPLPLCRAVLHLQGSPALVCPKSSTAPRPGGTWGLLQGAGRAERWFPVSLLPLCVFLSVVSACFTHLCPSGLLASLHVTPLRCHVGFLHTSGYGVLPSLSLAVLSLSSLSWLAKIAPE